MSTIKQSSELVISFLGLKSRSRKGLFGLQVHYYSSDKISEGFFSYFTLVYKGIYMKANLLSTSKALKTMPPEKWDSSVLAKKVLWTCVSVQNDFKMFLRGRIFRFRFAVHNSDTFLILQYSQTAQYMLWFCNPIVSLSLLNIFSSWYNGNRDGINDCN